MKRSWSADLKLVTVPQGTEPKPVTVIYPYYENPEFLSKQLRSWCHVQDEGPLTYIVVDDGSPRFPAKGVITSSQCKPEPESIRLFRIEVDIRWNWLAARNIGFKHAPEGWCFVTDMDHVIPEDTLRACIYGAHDESKIYGFSRQEHTGETIAPHPNSWFLTKEMFWKVGGYDEALSGHYGTDGDWRRRMAKVAEIQILTDKLIRYEHQGDSSTTKYKRKQPEDAAVSKIIKMRGKGWKPKVLSFEYHEVHL